MTSYILDFAYVSKLANIIYQVKALIKSNRIIHVASNSDEKQRNYGCSKLFFVNYSPNMVLLWSRDQIQKNDAFKF